MSNIPQNCIFNNIQMREQDISDKQILELLHNLYKNVIFSTFPYTLYKENNSENCLYKYNSGNCIALSHAVKNYLSANYQITSHIISASVPKSCKTYGTPHLTHCAVLIPLSNHEFCIIDTALYFLDAMYCDLKNNIERKIQTSDVYNHNIRNVNYAISNCNDCKLDVNYNQILKENSLCVSCYFENDESENWNYYLNEIVNPDNNISHSYLKHKNEPFMMYTKMRNNIPVLKYKLKVNNEDGLIVVKQYPENEIIFNGNSEEFDKTRIKNDIRRYLSNVYSV